LWLKNQEQQPMWIRNGRIVLPDRVIENGAIVIDESSGRIAAVGPNAKMGTARFGETIVDAHGGLVAPGFIDMHCHGAWDADFMDATAEAFETVTAYHAAFGTTALLATSTSGSTDAIVALLERAREMIGRPNGGSEILGVHLEGPWLNPERRGCHLESAVHEPSADEVRVFMRHADIIRSITLAPEIAGLGVVRRFANAGVVIAAGHSDMTYDDMMPAIEAGVRHVTHIFCAMSTTVRRNAYRHPGVLETTLLDDRLTTEMIADGKHLPAPLMQLAYKCKGVDRLALVSDAMRGAGMPPGGRYTFGPRDGTPVIVADGVAMMTDLSAFASSTTPLSLMVKTCVETVGLPLHVAVAMASLTPARILGVADRKGSLAPGKDADVVVMDGEFRVKTVIVGGKFLDPARLAAQAPADAVV
jgi:N-acetylglucosamine-6-phosphate deacetylase